MQVPNEEKSVFLHYMTAGWALLTVVVGLYFLLVSMKPTADVEAKYQISARSISVENWKPGDVKTLLFDGKPVVLWRRNVAEIATAMAQLEPDIQREEWSEVLNDGTLALEIGPDAYIRLEWFIVSPINVGGYGCVVLTKAGDYEGFFDPCQNVHFDMWGRARKGPTKENLKVTPAQFTEDQQSVFLDLSEMPSTN